MTHALFSSVQSLSHGRLCDPKYCSTPGSLFITNSWNLLKLMYIKVVMPPNHLILCCPLLLKPSLFPSVRVFSYDSVLLFWQSLFFFFLNSDSSHPDGFYSKESAYKVGDPDSILGKLLLEKGMATHCSILAWRIPRTEEPGGL